MPASALLKTVSDVTHQYGTPIGIGVIGQAVPQNSGVPGWLITLLGIAILLLKVYSNRTGAPGMCRTCAERHRRERQRRAAKKVG